MTRAWTRSCAACSVRKGLIFLMLCNANLQDRAVFVMWSLKVSWSSNITPSFLTELDGVIVEEPSWMVKSCCRVGVAVLWIPPLPRPHSKTNQWDRIQTSEVESHWYPVMRGWTGGSDDWQCQKRQTDPAEWGLMTWNRLLQFAGLQWLRVVLSPLNGHSWNLTV